MVLEMSKNSFAKKKHFEVIFVKKLKKTVHIRTKVIYQFVGSHASKLFEEEEKTKWTGRDRFSTCIEV